MTDLREIVDEITALGADDGGMLAVSANRLRRWRHCILALVGEAEPVGWTSENELRHLRNGACASMIAYRDDEEPAYTIPLYAYPALAALEDS